MGVLVVNVANIDGVEYKESCQQDKDTSSQITSPHQERRSFLYSNSWFLN